MAIRKDWDVDKVKVWNFLDNFIDVYRGNNLVTMFVDKNLDESRRRRKKIEVFKKRECHEINLVYLR